MASPPSAGVAEAEARRRVAIIRQARRWLGTPWHPLGRSRHGCDGVGLVILVCQTLGISGHDVASRPRASTSGDLLGHFLQSGGVRAPLEAALPGDLMLFREARFRRHVAILADRDGLTTIIHAHSSRGMVLEEVMTVEWLRHRVAAIRLSGTRPSEVRLS